MYIELITEYKSDYGANADFIRLLPSKTCHAYLKFYLGPFTCSYYGEDNDIGNAVMMAIQGFLSGELYNNQVASERNGIGLGWEQGIQFDPSIHPEIKTIIEQAIDLKTGGDHNKLTQTLKSERRYVS